MINKYVMIRQKNAINSIITFEPSKCKHLTNKVLENEEITFFIDDDKPFEFSLSMKKLLLFVLCKASAVRLTEEYPLVNISLEEYMNIARLNNKASARRDITKDLEALKRIRFIFKDKNHKVKNAQQSVKTYDFHIIGKTTKFSNGEIQAVLTSEFIQFFNTLPKMLLPTEIFSIDVRYNPTAFYVLWALSYLNNINRNNKQRQNVILIKTLLRYCPNLPNNYEELKRKGTGFKRVIEPFERALNSLTSVIEWQYLTPLNEAKETLSHSISEFLELKLLFKFKGLKEQEENTKTFYETKPP